jgi:hypothetical protein
MSIKFTQLPPATLPLAGDEILCIVQDGLSKQVVASQVGGGAILALGGELAFTAVAGVNDNVAFGASYNRLLVDTSAGPASISGIVAGIDGQICIVTNRGAGTLTLLDANVGSTPANQLYGVTDITNPARGSFLLQYSGTLSRWVMV